MNWMIFLIALVVIIGWFAWTYISVRRSAKFINNAEFESMIHTSQLIDVREAAAFKTKHIMGARNLPASQIQLKNLIFEVFRFQDILTLIVFSL